MKPSSWRQSTITCVSSLQSAPCSVVSPPASAARTSARFVMLLEPGTVMSARTGCVSGTISMRSGRGMGLSLHVESYKLQVLERPLFHVGRNFSPWQRTATGPRSQRVEGTKRVGNFEHRRKGDPLRAGTARGPSAAGRLSTCNLQLCNMKLAAFIPETSSPPPARTRRRDVPWLG